MVGAGVVGLAIAEYVARIQAASFSILLLEKNPIAGQETSSRSSEVIHAGIYYSPDSLKARLCVEGRRLLYQYCAQYGVAHRKVGKFIVAQDNEEDALHQIVRQARANGVEELEWTSVKVLLQHEPLVRASHALYSSETGIIDSHAFMDSLLWKAQSAGVQFSPNTTVTRVTPENSHFVVNSVSGSPGNLEPYVFRCTSFINAAGLHAADLAARIEGSDPTLVPRLYLVRGCYFSLSGKPPFRHLIYPVPERAQKGLGVHATLDMTGHVRFGPDVEYIDAINYHVDESRRTHFLQAVQRYYPAVRAEQLQPAYAGIRPKLSAPDAGAEDFLIQDMSSHHMPGLVQLFGIESPGLTAALAIARNVSERLGL
ncbi:MAG: NAD(P)/FAD-dependent oxidoreductase [Gammaproteobacteria bacterium]|nr:NAD(P)/FAD-dependent oxidoreductase [Gammaproteobacteria bacterium]